MSSDDKPIRPGRGVTGKPFKEGNTRPDGDYKYGKNRPPAEHQFAKGDNRKRGVRAKGTKNLLTDWREELSTKIDLKEGGAQSRTTKQRALVKKVLNRALTTSDRAAETALRYAESSERRDPGIQTDDLEIIAVFMAQWTSRQDSDDADQLGADPSDDDRKDK